MSDEQPINPHILEIYTAARQAGVFVIALLLCVLFFGCVFNEREVAMKFKFVTSGQSIDDAQTSLESVRTKVQVGG